MRRQTIISLTSEAINPSYLVSSLAKIILNKSRRSKA